MNALDNSPVIHQMECDAPWFSMIRDKKKPVEGRKGKEKYRKIKPGDLINFYNGSEQFLAKVKKIDEFSNLSDYLNGVGLKNALPDIKTLEDGIQIYLQWSTLDEIDKLGFLGIWIEPIKI